MKSDSREAWKNRGHRFEVFRPKHENPEPSKWYVALYALLNPALVFGLRLRRWRRGGGGGGDGGEEGWGWLLWMKKGKKKKTTIGKEVDDENDLPWVL